MAQSICAIPYPSAYYIGHSGGEIVYAGETTQTSYSYLGDTLTQVNIDAPTGSTSLHFTYDDLGPMSVTYNGAEYFYLKNAQGDVTGLVNNSGTQVVAYTYDAWGNPLTTTGSMADKLHVTDRAVSKWERGLSYPDVTLFFVSRGNFMLHF